jgi:hypothetical protein
MAGYSVGVSLITFIEELFAQPYANQILDSIPDNADSKTQLREAFKS